MDPHRAIEIVDFEQDAFALGFEDRTIMLAVRIVIGIEGVEAAHSFKNASSLGEGNGLDASCDHDSAPDESRTQLIVQSAQALSCCGHGRSLSIRRVEKSGLERYALSMRLMKTGPPVASECFPAAGPTERAMPRSHEWATGGRGEGVPSPARLQTLAFGCKRATSLSLRVISASLGKSRQRKVSVLPRLSTTIASHQPSSRSSSGAITKLPMVTLDQSSSTRSVSLGAASADPVDLLDEGIALLG